MSKVLIINGHQPYPFAPGKLTASLIDAAVGVLHSKGHQTRIVNAAEAIDGVDVQKELENHQWADSILLQCPTYWMGVPWAFKKYMDDVYNDGMSGILCHGDGRTRSDPKKNYGAGGTLTGKKYMLSLTFNAPEEAFNDPDEYLFQGKSVDDLWFPMHMNFRFFGMDKLDTFVCYDVMKNPDVEQDIERFRAHINDHF